MADTKRTFQVGDHVYHERLRQHGYIAERTSHTHPNYERVDFGDRTIRVRRDNLTPLVQDSK